MKEVETIIIGAGISGLSCARKLQDNNKDFLVISPDIGGRMITSKDGQINYAAYVVDSNYKNISPYIRRTRKLDLNKDFKFHIKNPSTHLLTPSLFRYLPLGIIFALKQIRFDIAYSKFKKDCKNISQAKAIEKSKYLTKIFTTKVSKSFDLSKLDKDLASKILCISNSVSFSKPTNRRVFGMHQLAQLVLYDPHEFIFLKDKLINDFKSKIVKDLATKISSKEGKHIVTTKKGEKYTCKNLVIATPISVSNKLLKLNLKMDTVLVNMIHLKGKIKEEYSLQNFQLFLPKNNDVCVIAKQSNGDYLYYYHGKPNIKKFFTNFKIMKKHNFDPAIEYIKKPYLESNLGNNQYLIGDFNVTGIEDCFITGIYAANQILKNK